MMMNSESLTGLLNNAEYTQKMYTYDRKCLDKYANTSAASIPVLLDEMNRMKILKQGQSMLLAGFGAGLTWAGCLFEW